MEQVSKKLWNKDFSLVALCNAIALLGNMTLTFALAYYVLDITGSEAMFGLALSVTYIPLLVMNPIAGIMADRLRKQRIMFWIDISVVALILVYMAVYGHVVSALPIVFVKLLALNAIQGAYMSTTQAAVPLVVPAEKLASGNALMGMVNALVGAGGQALAAVLFSRFGLTPILIIFAVVYGITAIMDLFIRVPYTKQEAADSIFQLVKNDMAQAIRFAVKEKPVLAKFSVVIFVFGTSVVSLLIVGGPVLIVQTLGMDLGFVGIVQIFIAIGGIAGGVTAGALGSRLTIRATPLILMIICILPIPMGLAIMFNLPTMVIFVVITAVFALIMLVNTIFMVAAMTFVQTETPALLLGKVLGLLSMLPILEQALGQFVFGVLFEAFADMSWVVVFIAVGVAAVAAVYSRRVAREV